MKKADLNLTCYLAREDNYWELPIADYDISATSTEWIVEFKLKGSLGEFTLQIESPFTFHKSNNETTAIEPGNEAIKTMEITQTTVQSIYLYDDGKLQLSFTDGNSIEIESSDEFEAWNLTGPDDFRVVSTTDHMLSIWHNEIN